MREDIKKRRAKYKDYTSKASELFSNKDLIVERKSGMNFVHYRYMLDIQKRTLKKLFSGSPNERIARLMRPTIPSLHLQQQVEQRRMIKHGYLEEVKSVGRMIPNFFTNIFNFIRRLAGLNDSTTTKRIPALV